MLSKLQNKYIRSLSQQKIRDEHQVFIAEGIKIAEEWLKSRSKIQYIIAVESWFSNNIDLTDNHPEAEQFVVKESELEMLSGLNTPNQVILVVNKPAPSQIIIEKQWYLALENIQDPGNLGTMIRIADWFGIKQILCSEGCVDAYNPKVVQAAMGSHLRVNVIKDNLPELLQKIPYTKYAATLGGENIHKIKPVKAGVIIIGNESKGLSEDVIKSATCQVTIPRHGNSGAESLNAGVSAGILCALLLPC